MAQWQAGWVADRLSECGVAVELRPITTTGDREQLGPIESLGTQGAFTKEIQRALLEGAIDLAVHSLKDLPTEPVEGLCLAAVPERAEVADVLVCRSAAGLAALPAGAVVGTGSLRRRAQLLWVRGDLAVRDIRGNVDTRLDKVARGDYEAILLARAGLVRLGLESRITETLPFEVMLPAVGQGALGVETRGDDYRTRAALAAIDHFPSHAAVLAERAMLAALRGGCLAPVAALGRVEGDRLSLTGRVLGPEGGERIEFAAADAAEAGIDLGCHVAAALIERGAARMIEAARRPTPRD